MRPVHHFAGRVRIRLFRTTLLEFGTLTPFPVFATAWTVLLSVMLYSGSFSLGWATVGTAILGIVIWILFEYAMHRAVFHFETSSAVINRMIFLLHENHHEDPSDPLRGLMPLPVTIPIALTVWLSARLLGPTIEAGAIGFLIGYVLYDATHWCCHQRPMHGRIGTLVKRHHLRHHHIAQNRNFAITAIFLDRWFGTALKRR